MAQAHAHNDDEHGRPLFDAPEHGSTSVEADGWLVEGELRVAHDAGYRVRFWATNDIAGQARERMWTQLQAAGVDHTSTENLPGLQEFLTPERTGCRVPGTVLPLKEPGCPAMRIRCYWAFTCRWPDGHSGSLRCRRPAGDPRILSDLHGCAPEHS
ncbi:hypothetical protein [uncultured Kocuria sp.]|uniref:hypothetical protein n=1 Tax=uncultured Kocuria sp. TaxID=259305 RepID=UPI002630CAEA|nr:hypothetical protein [uncultured Kocuria sp.]